MGSPIFSNELMQRVKEQGFVFIEQVMSDELVQELLSLKLNKTHVSYGKDASLQLEKLPVDIDSKVRSWMSSNLQLKKIIHDLNFSAHQFIKDEEMLLHSDFIHEGDVQVLTWICEDDQFIGRDFLYGKKGEELKSIRPFNGLIGILDLTSDQFIHGVSPLKSDSKIITICASKEY